jgi:hypothetical protein
MKSAMSLFVAEDAFHCPGFRRDREASPKVGRIGFDEMMGKLGRILCSVVDVRAAWKWNWLSAGVDLAIVNGNHMAISSEGQGGIGNGIPLGNSSDGNGGIGNGVFQLNLVNSRL